MPKRGRKKKVKINFNLQRETVISVSSVVLIVLSILSFISFFAPDYYLNNIIQGVLRGLFGYPSIIVPFIMALFGLLFIERFQAKIKEGRIVLGLFLLLISFSAFFHLFVDSNNSLNTAQKGEAGGFIGHLIANSLKQTVSIYGALPIVLAGFLTSTLLIFDLTLSNLLSFLHLPSISVPSFIKNKKKSFESLDNADVVSDILDKDFNFDFDNKDKAEIKESKKEPKKDIKTTIEIVPTMSEPQKEIKYTSQESVKKPNSTVIGADKIWSNPPLDLLNDPINEEVDLSNTKERAKIITDKLRINGIGSKIVDIIIGPTVTLYVLDINKDVKLQRILNLDVDLGAALSSSNGKVKIQAPIPGTPHVGIEVPNEKRSTVFFKTLINSKSMKDLKSKIGIVLGKDTTGKIKSFDIAKMPHLLVAGATGAGKSIFIHNIMLSILYRASPQDVKFILIDPKRVELSFYDDLPHLLTPVLTDIKKAPSVFKWAAEEMDNRYKKLQEAKVQHIDGYNEKAGFQSMPYIVIIVDEFTDIMMNDAKNVEPNIIRLASLARATGIHLILAMQRPTKDVITGLIKANFPTRIAFTVSSNVDSKVIIDYAGAEKLLSKGDMLFMQNGSNNTTRIQAAFVSENEIKKVVNFIKNQGIEPNYKEEVLTSGDSGGGSISSAGYDDVDEKFDESVDLVVSANKASASMLQTKLSIGYARAARILEQLEDKGIVGPANGSKPREVLVDGFNNDAGMNGSEDTYSDNLTSLN